MNLIQDKSGVGEDYISEDDRKTKDCYNLHSKLQPKITEDRR